MKFVIPLRNERLEVRNLLSAVAFANRPQVDENVSHVRSADIDRDSDFDIVAVSKPNREIVWYENQDARGNFGESQLISSERTFFFVVVDVEGDGDADIVTYSNKGITWLENKENGIRFEAQSIDTDSRFKGRLIANDFDGDGDADVAWGTTWYEFDSSLGEYTNRHRIGTGEFMTISGGDLDGDGDFDLIYSMDRTSIEWVENPNGNLGWVEKTNTSIEWIENTNGKGSFANPRPLQAQVERWRHADVADFDGDGDLDVIIDRTFFYEGPVEVTIHENTDGRGTFVERWSFGQAQSTIRLDGGDSPCIGDFDGDGDVDVILNWRTRVSREDHDEPLPPFGIGFVLENVDNDWLFEFSRTPIMDFQTNNYNAYATSSCTTVDYDRDGDQDVAIALDQVVGLGASDSFLAWHENRLVGDANDDGVVEFADFLALATNFGKNVDAVWKEGDWDGNGQVDFADFLALAANFGNERHSQA